MHRPEQGEEQEDSLYGVVASMWGFSLQNPESLWWEFNYRPLRNLLQTSPRGHDNKGNVKTHIVQNRVKNLGVSFFSTLAVGQSTHVRCNGLQLQLKKRPQWWGYQWGYLSFQKLVPNSFLYFYCWDGSRNNSINQDWNETWLLLMKWAKTLICLISLALI